MVIVNSNNQYPINVQKNNTLPKQESNIAPTSNLDDNSPINIQILIEQFSSSTITLQDLLTGLKNLGVLNLEQTDTTITFTYQDKNFTIISIGTNIANINKDGVNPIDEIEKIETKNIESPEETKIQTTDNVTQLTEEEAIAQGYTVIKTLDDLKKIAENLDGKYILMADIEMQYPELWTPIGSKENPFTGIFNGNGFTLTNFATHRTNYQSTATKGEPVGFFSCTDGAEISNITLKDAYISGSGINMPAVGTLIGEAKNTKLINCTVDSSDAGGGLNAGGLVGIYTCDSTIDPTKYVVNCSVKNTEVQGQHTIGGLFGKVNLPSTGIHFMDNCHSDAKVEACSWGFAPGIAGDYEYAGGLIGNMEPISAIITNCTVTGSIEGCLWEKYEEVYATMVGNDVSNSFVKYANCAVNDLKWKVSINGVEQPHEYISIELNNTTLPEEQAPKNPDKTDDKIPNETNKDVDESISIVTITSDQYESEMTAEAEKFNFKKTEHTGVYIMIKNDNTQVEYIWHPYIKRFISPNLKGSPEWRNNYYEGLKLAYNGGFNLTSYINLYEKDGDYYKYDPETQKLIKLTEEEAKLYK